MKTKLSRDDAVAMLKKWEVGSTLISGTITSGSGSVRIWFMGYVSEVSRLQLKIIQATVSENSEKIGEISIGLNAAQEFESDVRETQDQPGSVSALQIHLAGLITCAIFEYSPKYKM